MCQVSMSLGRPMNTLQANFTGRKQVMGADTIQQKSLKLIKYLINIETWVSE